MGFSAALCRGLIEAIIRGSPGGRARRRFSAALCRGLIEAPGAPPRRAAARRRFPRLYAAASLKRARGRAGARRARGFSAALCRLDGRAGGHRRVPGFSAALCRGLIEASRQRSPHSPPARRFLRLYAAASLKPVVTGGATGVLGTFSAALCRGLIEAVASCRRDRRRHRVFCGFMPRPH